MLPEAPRAAEQAVSITALPSEASRPAPPLVMSAPRLRIAHLMLWTACSAGFLSLHRHWLPEAMGAEPSAMWAAWAFMVGPSLAALVVFPVWQWQGFRFPTYPGEWLLLISGVFTALALLRSPLQTALLGDLPAPTDIYDSILQDRRIFQTSAAVTCGVITVVALMACWATLRFKGPDLWRRFFVVFAFTLVIAAVYAGQQAIEGWSPEMMVHAEPITWSWRALLICLTVMLFSAVLRDFFRPERLPWTHWTGAVFLLIQTAVAGVQMLLA